MSIMLLENLEESRTRLLKKLRKLLVVRKGLAPFFQVIVQHIRTQIDFAKKSSNL